MIYTNNNNNTNQLLNEQNSTTMNTNMPPLNLPMDKLGLYQKIQQGKKEFLERDIKKTGKNRYQKYDYYELKDIIPTILYICEKYDLYTQFEFTNTQATLHVYDLISGESTEYQCPLPVIEGGDARKNMQDIGALQTYARRYLYLAMFDIVEADPIDAGNPNNEDTNEKNSKGKVTIEKEGSDALNRKDTLDVQNRKDGSDVQNRKDASDVQNRKDASDAQNRKDDPPIEPSTTHTTNTTNTNTEIDISQMDVIEWNPTDVHTQIQGELLKVENNVGRFNSKIYYIKDTTVQQQTLDGEKVYKVNSTKVLLNAMKRVSIGDEVCILFEGFRTSNAGYEYKLYKVTKINH